ncbi:hypothetical protein BBJ29_009192 [Phytophthora kernoviae]|uniref:Uncharacterized protein n=1 Tax=Phytophthora kernoviae TaxID=325452 RepID=A0A421G9F6_9STRA|nr:hypothetical protein BBJ29_009192 [Phytophthora kernoviae]
MGLDPKYCKVTVHPASIKASPPRVRRQTVGDESIGASRRHPYKRAPPPQPPYKAYSAAVYDNVNELQEDDTDDIAVLSEDEPFTSSRRRAHTTSSLSSVSTSRLSNRLLNPLSRMALRWNEQDAAAKKSESHIVSESSTTSASTTPEMLDTPPPMIDLANSFLDFDSSFLDVDTNGSDEIMRPTLDDTASLMAGTPPIPAGLTLDMLPTEYETPPIPSHLREVLLHNQNQEKHASPFVVAHSDCDDESESDYDDDVSSVTTEEYDEDSTNHSVDIDSIRQTRGEAVANFEASMRARNRPIPCSRITEIPRKARHKVGGSARNIRGLSSPPRMHSQVVRPRKGTVPNGNHADEAKGISAHSNDRPAVPMYHGQELHLGFKTSTSLLTQPHELLEDVDTLRIIGHTTDGLLRGGDCVSFARTDGTVLRMQKMSKKLAFSNKVDVRAKFIITGVPDRTPVTSTSKFYLQSVHDRKKTVGFMPSRRESRPGCLAMYVHRNAEDKVEPIQFFKRQPGHGLAFWHHPQQWV